VNTASRMESYGEPNRIHVSEAFRNLAADRFVFEERGATEIEGSARPGHSSWSTNGLRCERAW